MSRHTVKLHHRTILSGALLGLVSVGISISSLAQESRTRPEASTERPNYALRVSTKGLTTISLKAEKIPLSNITGEISKKIKVPILLGPSAAKRQITTDFKALPLESAMQLLVPYVFIDYEINRSPGAPPQPVGVYLNAENDPPPAINTVIANNSQALLIEGHTEEGLQTETAPKDQPLRVTYERSVLTVKAKQQPLSVVLYKIASELGIPFELKGDANEVVDLDINKMPLEDAVLRMSPHVRLYVRADLARMERRPFLMVLAAPKGL